MSTYLKAFHRCSPLIVATLLTHTPIRPRHPPPPPGIDFFFFDWYWYKEMNPPTGGTFLGGPLEDGFLKAPNLASSGMQFALMWCTQVWLGMKVQNDMSCG